MLHRASRRHPQLLASFTLLTALAMGCGGKVLVDGTGADGAGGTGGTGTTNGSVTSTTVGVTSTSTGQGAGGISTGPGSSTSTGPSSSGTETVSVSSSSGVGASSGAGGSAPVPQVFCNNQPCNDGEVCCFNLTMPTDHCGQAGTCGDGYIQLDCNGPEDCPSNQICCAHLNPNQGMVPYTGIACEDSCQGMDTRIVCGSAGSAVCNPGDKCKGSMTLGDGYKVCRP